MIIILIFIIYENVYIMEKKMEDHEISATDSD